MKNVIVLLIVVIVLFASSAGCQMTRAQRTGAGAGIGAAGGAGLGSAIGAAFGAPGLGALFGALGGALVGGATGTLWPDESEKERQEIEKLLKEREMGIDRLSEAIKQTNLSPEEQDVYMSHARKISAEARQQGKDVRFYVEPGQGMKYKLIDLESETKTAPKEEPVGATPTAPQ